MKKVVAFGAGSLGVKWLRDNRNYYEVLAFLDNDSNKWGKSIENIPILNPADIGSIEYDSVIVTTMFAPQVTKQLKMELNVSQGKIDIAPKLFVHPFEDDLVRNIGSLIIVLLMRESISKGIQAWLDFGTLLGVYRDNDIIRWDGDIDIGVIDCDAENFLSICLSLNELLSAEQVSAHVTISEKKVDYALYGISIVVHCMDSRGDDQSFPVSVSIYQRQEGKVYELTHLDWFQPKEDSSIFPLTVYLYKNQPVHLPSLPEDYLERLYGKDWRAPNKNFTFNDYKNVLP
jgi:lipopolysaccharide cholinephosphotransferase